MQGIGQQSVQLVKLHLQQMDYYGAWQTFRRIEMTDEARKDTLMNWLKSGYELYHFQFDHLFSTLSELYEEEWISHEQFALAWDHWDHLIHHQGITMDFLLDSLQDAAHHMELYLEIENYLAFLTRLYRFRELLILYLYLVAGRGDLVNQYQPGRAPDQLDQLEELYLTRVLNSHYGVYMFLQSKQLIEVIRLRNHSLIGHGRVGATNTSIWQMYEGKWYQNNRLSVQAFMNDMRILFQDLGVEWSDNPYRILMQSMLKALDTATAQRPEWTVQLPDEVVFRENVNQYRYQALLNQLAHHQLPTKLQQSLECGRSLLLGTMSVEQCQVMKHLLEKYAEAVSGPSLHDLLIPLAEGKQTSFINYLYAQIEVYDRQHDYGELMIRVYRLMEELMIYFLGYDVNSTTLQLQPRTNAKPRVIVKSHTFSGLMETLQRAAEVSPHHDFYGFTKESWWNGVAEVHRHSIVGHGIEAITKEHIEDALHLTLPELRDKLVQVMRLVGISLKPNYFDQLNGLILWKYRVLQVNE